jgi:16S rRNA (guanine1207-N2)-methyltransferase
MTAPDMTALGSLILRNLSGINADDRILWINPPADDSWASVSQLASEFSIHCQNFGNWKAVRDREVTAGFSAFPAPDVFDHILLCLPHSKPRLEMMLDCISSMLSPGGRLWLAGENKAGIRSAASRLQKQFGSVSKLDNARHSVLFEARQQEVPKPFDRNKYLVQWQPENARSPVTICSWPGVFAHGRLDKGTDLLIKAIPDKLSGPGVLDFGCGCGVISAIIGKQFPKVQTTMIDNDALALLSAEETMNINNLEAKILASDGLSDVQGKFDLIISNPPFHQSHQTDTSLSMKLLGSVRNFLHKNGSLVMVVNRHIPYPRWLDTIFDNHKVLAADNSYQVLQATRAH